LSLSSELLNDRYRLLKVIGKGSMGTVYLAEDCKLNGKRWAVKVVEGSDIQTQLAEARMLSSLDHPHIPRVVDVFARHTEGELCIVMDYVVGETLRAKFERVGRSLELQTIIHIAIQVCDLYVYLHEQLAPAIIHRDLKPDNLMVDERWRVKLIDFGIARQTSSIQMGETLPFASAGFASPEQWTGKSCDARSDLYSLGALMYYLVSGGHFVGLHCTDDSRNLQGVPTFVVQLLEKLLHPDPAVRPACASALMEALRVIEQKLRFPLHSVPKSSRKSATKVIVCRGITGRSGCTHGALMIAHGLAHLGRRVALIEQNSHPILGRLFREQRATAHKFAVDYLFDVQSLDMAVWLYAGYDDLVFDFGSELSEAQEGEFARADVPLVTAFGGLLGVSLANSENMHDSEYPPSLQARMRMVLMLAASQQTASAFDGLQLTDAQIHEAPFCANPLQPTEEVVSFVCKLLGLETASADGPGNRLGAWLQKWIANRKKERIRS
jgi:hypothetical protein